MVMCTRIEGERKQFCFQDFPGASMDYLEEPPEVSSDLISFKATDEKSGTVFSVFMEGKELRRIGIFLKTWKKLGTEPERLSILVKEAGIIDRLLRKAALVASEHLSAPFLTFFTEDRTFANRVIQGLLNGPDHSPKIEGIPGIYFHRWEGGIDIFINLKKTPPLGIGGYGKVRKVLWLSAPDERSMLVAKKVFKSVGTSREQTHFRREVHTLRQFRDQRGIIELIASGTYEGKHAMFLPIYECDLTTYLIKEPFLLTLNEKLSMASQWLEGLATLSEKGIHGDLSSRNLLLRRGGKEGIEAVICDFGTFCPGDQGEYGVITIRFGSPEYFLWKMVTPKQDVWALGISLHRVFSKRRLPCLNLNHREEMRRWASTLHVDWALEYPIESDVPPFLSALINAMLNPNPHHRPSAKQAFEYFSKELNLLLERA